MGRRLGARYLLVGNLRREGDERVAHVHLIEAETGRELLAQPFRYASQDPLGGRGLAAVLIAGDVNMMVVTTEGRRPLPAAVEAGHYTLIAFAAAGQLDSRDMQEHLALHEKALALDPNWVPALLGYSWMQTELGRLEPPERRAECLDKAQAAIERAIQLAPREAMGYHHLGVVLRARGDPVGAIAAVQHALTFNPNLANAHGTLGLSKLQAGLAHESRAHIEEALRLRPGHRWQALWSFWAGQAAVHTGDYEAAVAWLQKAAHGKVTRQAVKPWLAVAHAGLGREKEGRADRRVHQRKPTAHHCRMAPAQPARQRRPRRTAGAHRGPAAAARRAGGQGGDQHGAVARSGSGQRRLAPIAEAEGEAVGVRF
jgi:tetratricopeptide (TPR) repeat protein